MKQTLKALSLDQQCEAARRAVYRAMDASRREYYGDAYLDNAYPLLVYPDYVIVQEGIQYFKVPYTIAATGVTVPARIDWPLTEQSWKSSPLLQSLDETTIAIGGSTAVKALGDGKVGGYLVQFSTKSDPDLTGEFFTAETDFDIEDGAPTAIYYHHGMDTHVKTRKLGTGTIKKDAIGVWVEAQLKLRDDYEKSIYKLAEQGKLGWSSGTAVHLAEYKPAGKATEITRWPLGLDASLTPTPAEPRTRVLPLKSYDPPQATLTGGGDPHRSDASAVPPSPKGKTMDKELEDRIAATVALAIKADREEQEAKAQKEAVVQARIDDAVKAAKETQASEWAKSNRLPGGDVSAPVALKYSELRKYNHLDAAEQSLMVSLLTANYKSGRGSPPPDAALKALAIKMDEAQTEDGEDFRYAVKSAGIKANEVMYSTLASFGDEWVSTAWESSAWAQIRQPTSIVGKIPTITIPQGEESVTIPLEGADPTWYKIAQTTATNATTLTPDATVPTSQMGTAQKIITAAKMGARVLISGELEEDSIVPIMAQLRMQLATSAGEMLEHVVIDGDTATGATTNINDIGGTPAATDLFLLLNGFRKSCLVTTTANSRAGGTLTSGDFLATIQLMGAAGINALDISKVGFIVDPNVHWAALELADVKSRDVFAAATIESGKLSGIYGYAVNVSAFMHYMSAVRKANTAGKVDRTTPSNNTTGSILAIRWDQWLLAYKRRITIETVRVPRSDHTEVTALLRVGLGQRDTEASAISYGITVS